MIFRRRARVISQIKATFRPEDGLGVRGEIEIEAYSDGSFEAELELSGLRSAAPVQVRVGDQILMEEAPRLGRIDIERRLSTQGAPAGVGPDTPVSVMQAGHEVARATFRLDD